MKKITEGMDLKVIKSKKIKVKHPFGTDALLVKLPTGVTAWITR
ncbi:MAG: hypothetical protein ABXS93_05825 [Sulfurimonas sp.]